jgi:hypothetical protein
MSYRVGQRLWLLCDVPYPDTGASVEAGAEVVVLTADEGSYLVETLKETWDPGTGCNDGTEGYRTSSFEAETADLADLSHARDEEERSRRLNSLIARRSRES